MKLRVTGLEGIDAALREIKQSTGKAAVRRVLTRALEPVRDTAKQLVPVHEGRLRDSIVISTRLGKSAARAARKMTATESSVAAMRGIGEASRGSVTVYVGTANRNGVPREFGTVRSVASPFMRPAWDANKHRVLDTIQSELGAEIMKTAERAARRGGRK